MQPTLSAQDLKWEQLVGPRDVRVLLATSEGVLYASPAGSGGVFRSDDKGITWVNSGLSDRRISSLAAIGTTIFVGTDRTSENLIGEVYRSDDKGNTWTKTNLRVSGRVISSLAVMGTTLFAGVTAGGGGVYRSDDKGNTWTAFVGPGGIATNDIFSLAVMDTTIFAGTGLGVIHSDNGGNTWVRTGLNRRIGLFAVMGTTLFAADEPDPSADSKVYRSDNKGDTWIEANTGLSDLRVNAFAVMRGTIFASGVGFQKGGVFRSDDKGNSWTQVGLPGHTISSLAVMGTTLFAGTFGDALFRANVFDALPTPSTTSIPTFAPPVATITATSPITADSISSSVITITVKDSNGNSLPNKTVTISATGSDASGLFKVVMDATTLKDGNITVVASEIGGQEASITVIKDTKPVTTEKPEFLISALNPIQSAEVGKSMIYIINLISKGGLKSDLTLRIADAPIGIQAEFNPKVVNISAENPSNTSQLTIRVGNDTPIGDHKFIVSAVTLDKSTIKEIELQLQVKTPALKNSFITIDVEPTQPRLGDKLKVKGEVIFEDVDVGAQHVAPLPITISYKLSNGEEIPQSAQTDELGRYISELEVKRIGKWEIVASWAGDKTYKQKI